MKHKAIIIDDEAKGRLALKQKLADYCPEIEVVAEADNGPEGIFLIEFHKPRVVFLDIEMPRMNGFDMLNEIKEKNFHIIFTTAYDQYAIKAIRFAAFDYLLKPVDIDELKDAVAKIKDVQPTSEVKKQVELLRQNIQQPKPQLHKLAIPALEGLFFYDINDVVHLEANSNYTNIYFSNKTKIVASKTLKEFEELLPEEIFFRTHHSHIVNLNYIKRYIKGDGGQIELQSGNFVDVSRRKKDEFLKIIGL
ncbi:MAG: LytTR family DNA-binding domain-containing protein [Chitinophagaceae bacterium]